MCEVDNSAQRIHSGVLGRQRSMVTIGHSCFYIRSTYMAIFETI